MKTRVLVIVVSVLAKIAEVIGMKRVRRNRGGCLYSPSESSASAIPPLRLALPLFYARPPIAAKARRQASNGRFVCFDVNSVRLQAARKSPVQLVAAAVAIWIEKGRELMLHCIETDD
jgi:hypothetical protein